MPEIKTLYAVIKLLKINAKKGLNVSDFTHIGNINYNTAKQILVYLKHLNKVEQTLEGKWKLKN